MKWIGLFLGIFLFCHESILAQQDKKTSGSEIIDIPTDMLPPSSAGDPVPFFAEPTGSQEVFEQVKLLKERVEKLETLLATINNQDVRLKSKGKFTIEANGDIEMNTPGAVKVNGKKVE